MSLTVNEDGTVSLMAGTPDIGGLRASLATVAADELGVPYDKVRPIIGDTGSLGFNFLTGGSRSAFSGSMAIVEAAKQIKADLVRAGLQALGGQAGPGRVRGRRACGRSAPLAEKVKPMSIADFAKTAGKTGGPIGGVGRINAQGAGPSFGTHLVDLEVDPETGRATILRYTVAQDAGRALHPAYVEGQYQGGAVQGIGWALNEEYIYGPDGKLQNAGFLDYRMPVASDVPMIDAILVEVAQPEASLRRARGRRDADRAAARRHRQRDGERHRHPLHRAADVAAQGAQGAQGARASTRPEPCTHGARGAGRQPRAGHGGRRRVRSPGDVRAAALPAARRAPSRRSRAHLESGVAVAIDGQIFQDALLEPIGADSEVFLLPQIAGG